VELIEIDDYRFLIADSARRNDRMPAQYHEADGAIDADPLMPELDWPKHGYHHSVDSAWVSLLSLGLDPDRVTFQKAGRGWPPLRIVTQEPAPDQPIRSDGGVALTVAGDGLFDKLPTGLRDRGTEHEPGVDALVSVFDDPSEKAGCYVRQGGFYFDLRPENPAGCARWIRLFGIVPEEWPVEQWYLLARFLPYLHRLAGREAGIRLGVKLLLGLEIIRFEWRQQRTLLTRETQTQVGWSASRLGIDLVIGQGVEDETILKITLGPLSLAEYRRHQTQELKHRLQQVFYLVLPCHLAWSVHWLVGSPEFAPRLATEEENTVLGINMHLGPRFAKLAQ
jgi:hypothetical protein